jgi:GNAT superfamily N-acetyltransferase
MDFDWIYRSVRAEYWARQRSRSEMEQVMARSRNFGAVLDLPEGSKQIAYARVLTDGLVLVYLFDLVVDPAFRRMGYGRWLMERILEDPGLSLVNTWMLATKDAQGLYTRYGFKALVDGEPLMVRLQRQPSWSMDTKPGNASGSDASENTP